MAASVSWDSLRHLTMLLCFRAERYRKLESKALKKGALLYMTDFEKIKAYYSVFKAGYKNGRR
jgi:hypothetical protein